MGRKFIGFVLLSPCIFKTIKETSEIYSISRKTIIEWKKLKKQTGDVKAKSGYHTGHRRIIRDIEGIKVIPAASSGVF
ncbi:hypothetical protein [Rickettsia endosymbiont of Gonocerus acuteangulatus]|uniref:hypothetical protein n=1 Tax=Rickettsia endosymbiont of Gonocerus acuteangulatus TaxID=3066266 RepID=UPI003133178A